MKQYTMSESDSLTKPFCIFHKPISNITQVLTCRDYCALKANICRARLSTPLWITCFLIGTRLLM